MARNCAARLATWDTSWARPISDRWPFSSSETIAGPSASMCRSRFSAQFSRAPGNHCAPGIRGSARATEPGFEADTSKYSQIEDQNPSRSVIDQCHSDR